MNSNLGKLEIGTKSLTPEILLKIFLNLESHQIVIMRRICKEVLELVDNNRSLWKTFDWTQRKEESPIQALEMFDEKSASTLKEVSIFQNNGDLDFGRLIRVLDRSKESLNHLFLNIDSDELWIEAIELASNCPILNSLILWPSEPYWAIRFPKTRLTRTCRQYSSDGSRSSNLQVLWCNDSMEVLEGKLDLSSLVSFADFSWPKPLEAHSIISEFSSSLIHLHITLNYFQDSSSSLSSLSCPSLSVLEGCYLGESLPWLDAPKLRIIVADFLDDKLLSRLPVSVEEVWLLSGYHSPPARYELKTLSQVCPKLRILKLAAKIAKKGLELDDLLRILIARKEKVEQGVEIGGIKFRLLEKLIIPTELFKLSEVEELRGLVGEVIDIKDYPDFVEFEY